MAAPSSAPSSACWFLHDGLAGHRRQAAALAAALHPQPVEQVLEIAAPWAWAAPRRLPGARRAFGPEFAAALATPPALAIGCGRRAALATRLLHTRGSRAVQILHPRTDTRGWDLVIVPEHDGRPGANVINVCGSLNPIDAAWLSAARLQRPDFAALPGPRTVVLLGGPTAAVRFDAEAFASLAGRLDAVFAADGGSLLVLGSRRTDPAIAAEARRRWARTPGLRWFDAGDGDNPYASALAWADRIVCSPDSANMVSEACATPAPVFVAEPERAGGRIAVLLASLRQRGRIRAQDDRLAPFDVQPLRETPRIAALVRDRLGSPLA
ncbi:mitochondrial fission ELM1 family protein [Arenimonas composti]|uniref:Nucleoside-diphosphate sugar epimerase n=1 Tax=Arenimonas composti TR7-09 = DSM 18010 TaxID=1121013 RepID=A0A091BXU6_9GAMM|nr:mitochondrial fission ELM1 family protein [Arenimonas composti]KFN49180.1 hypothetical protein P873_12045 [Arenimonas composti TR7-09 = DSM 18010]